MLIKRFATITAGLVGAGAAAGSVVGFGFAMCLTALAYLTGSGPESLLFLLMAIVFVTGAGAVAGATLGPPAAWLLMRHVPLGKAVGGAAVGALAATLAGSVLGLLAGGGQRAPHLPSPGLRRLHRVPVRQHAQGEPPDRRSGRPRPAARLARGERRRVGPGARGAGGRTGRPGRRAAECRLPVWGGGIPHSAGRGAG